MTGGGEIVTVNGRLITTFQCLIKPITIKIWYVSFLRENFMREIISNLKRGILVKNMKSFAVWISLFTCAIWFLEVWLKRVIRWKPELREIKLVLEGKRKFKAKVKDRNFCLSIFWSGRKNFRKSQLDSLVAFGTSLVWANPSKKWKVYYSFLMLY